MEERILLFDHFFVFFVLKRLVIPIGSQLFVALFSALALLKREVIIVLNNLYILVIHQVILDMHETMAVLYYAEALDILAIRLILFLFLDLVDDIFI